MGVKRWKWRERSVPGGRCWWAVGARGWVVLVNGVLEHNVGRGPCRGAGRLIG